MPSSAEARVPVKAARFRLDEVVDPLLETDNANDSDFQSKIAQQTTDIVLDRLWLLNTDHVYHQPEAQHPSAPRRASRPAEYPI